MRKLTFIITVLLCAISAQAQFVHFDAGLHPQRGSIAVGDVNNDGNLDVIFSGVDIRDGKSYEQGAIMINNGDGTFTKQDGNRVITPCQLSQIKFGDINGDGHLDVIFTGIPAEGITNSVGIALNDGAGVFTLASTEQYPINDGYISCGFADFNNDGLLDYYIFGNGANNCVIYFQQLNGSFERSYTSFGMFNFVDPDVTVMDFNKDGHPDIFLDGYLDEDITIGDREYKAGRFSGVFINDMFGNLEIINQPGLIVKGYGSAAWADVDGDGYPDLVLNGDGGAGSGEESNDIVRVYRNSSAQLEPKAQFEKYRQISVGGGSLFVDWDNDGKMDVITGGWNETKGRQATSLFLGNGDFTFTESPLSDNIFPGVSENSFAIADLNNDGKADLMMMGFNGDQDNQVGKFQRNLCGYVLNTSANASVKPGAPTNLNMSYDSSEDMYSFSWAAPAATSTVGLSYNLSLRNTTTGKWFYNPMAVVGGEKNGWRKVSEAGNVSCSGKWLLYELPEGIYEWTVQAINGAYVGGEFAAVKTFTVGNPSSLGEVKYAPELYVENGKLNIKGDSAGNQTVNVYSINGTLIATTVFSENTTIELNDGIYVVEVKKEAAKPFMTKIIVQFH